jgi:transcriptional regulator with XRE-family HTH domain
VRAARKPADDERVLCMGRLRNTDIDRFLGRRIKELRVLTGTSQRQVAERLGVSNQQVQKYEKGINQLSPGQLLALAQAFEVAVADLFDGYHSEASRDPSLDPQTTQMLLNVTRSFLALEPKYQDALIRLVRALAAQD